jgi:rhamnulokinase
MRRSVIMPTRIAAIDLGAESGRVILADLAGDAIAVRTVHQFPTPAVRISGTLRWDVAGIWAEIQTGLKKLARESGPPASVGVDSWGVDYVLTRGDEPLLTLPFNYRDERCVGAIERAERKVARNEIFAETGIQFMPINTIYQLHEDVTTRDQIVAFADRALLIADYFNWLLSGVARAEETLASTTQLYNPRERRWSVKLAERLNIPGRILPEVVPAGTVLGPVAAAVAEHCGLDDQTKVIATCSHDTAAAVVAVPATSGGNWAYLSSGTWSLLGAELPAPVINDDSQRLNFTNEVGLGGSIRLLKNIIGLWPLQECRREWQAGGQEMSYADLAAAAAEAIPFRSIVDLSDGRFLLAGNMCRKLVDFCRDTRQPAPESPAQFTRCILESLALAYRRTLAELQQLVGGTIERLHIVGGGSQNELLNQMTADACGVRVVAGPAEATAIGNALVQAIALGEVKDLAHARRIVSASFPLKTYEPRERAAWAAAAEKLPQLTKNHA